MRIALRIAVALLVVGLAVALLVACGSQEDTAAPVEEETSGKTEEPSESPVANGPIEFTEIALVSESNVDGRVRAEGTVLDDEQAAVEFAGQFGSPRMARSVAEEYAQADVPEGEVVVGAVVDLSCEPPTEVAVEKTSQGVEITATPVKSTIQCLVPITTVALVSVPTGAV